MENAQERTKEVGSRSCVKSMKTDNTENIAWNLKDGLKIMEYTVLFPGSNPSHEPNAKGGAHPSI